MHAYNPLLLYYFIFILFFVQFGDKRECCVGNRAGGYTPHGSEDCTSCDDFLSEYEGCVGYRNK